MDDDEPVFRRSRWGTNRYVYNSRNPLGRALIVAAVLALVALMLLMANRAGPFAPSPDPDDPGPPDRPLPHRSFPATAPAAPGATTPDTGP
ncbi:hypothetical protein ACIBCM_25795 [Streptomyces sp. NPDC051018]|uniref:hypothetical protein n=1 Tax=Streptomyces sp. NPDC051018 TaxID=3365639 RepID=UPI0037B057DA